MARKPRDYKAEYARRKAIAQSKGTTPAKLRRMVKQGSYVPIKTPPKRVLEKIIRETPKQQERRRAAAHWSNEHSGKPTSRYSPSMTTSQVTAYHNAYVVYHPNHDDKMDALRDYLVDEMEYYDAEEYDDSDYYTDD